MNGDAEIAPPQVTTARLGTFGLAVKWLRLGLHILAGLGVLVCLPLAGSRAGRLAAWWYRRLLVVLGIAICLEGELPDRGCLAVANHVSWLDIIVLGSLLDAAFLSKSEIGGWPLVGRFARYTGTVFLTRGAGATRQVIGEMAGALRDNRSVVLFPEATTGRELAPARFHPRLFAAAVETSANVQPIAIHYLPDGHGAGHHPLAPWVGEAGICAHFLRLFALRGLRVRVCFCAPLTATSAHNRNNLAAASHAAIKTALLPGVA
ncbi:MAG: 1-acyl-sn-glycerol-3-phosphate acyltransferase [Salinisphaera sp.]|nr:1-acyl-sn-glycerol-3-phosphate acyltransferase [Salinisphaera sp.]